MALKKTYCKLCHLEGAILCQVVLFTVYNSIFLWVYSCEIFLNDWITFRKFFSCNKRLFDHECTSRIKIDGADNLEIEKICNSIYEHYDVSFNELCSWQPKEHLVFVSKSILGSIHFSAVLQDRSTNWKYTIITARWHRY